MCCFELVNVSTLISQGQHSMSLSISLQAVSLASVQGNKVNESINTNTVSLLPISLGMAGAAANTLKTSQN